MPHLIDTQDLASVLARACDRLLAEEGPAALTMRAISRASGVSTSSMIHHLDTRERLLGVCAHLAAKARLRAITDAVIDTGPTGVLPVDELGLVDARSWLGWLEVGRTLPAVEPALALAHNGELAVLARSLDHALAQETLSEVQALVDGLRLAVALGRMTGLEVSPTAPLVGRQVWGFPFVPQPRAVARSWMPT